eukprot:SAG11_NODE_28779_length_318_cov_0.634703_1_plen_59_part_10
MSSHGWDGSPVRRVHALPCRLGAAADAALVTAALVATLSIQSHFSTKSIDALHALHAVH